MWNVENVVLLVLSVISVAYSITMIKYSVKRRYVEKTMLLTLLALCCLALVYFIYSFVTCDLSFDIVKKSLYPKATYEEVVGSIVLNAPIIVTPAMLVITIGILRAKFRAHLSKPPYRKLIAIVGAYASLMFFNAFYSGYMGKSASLSTLLGPYPFQDNLIGWLQASSIVLLVYLVTLTGSIALSNWEKRMPHLLNLGEKVHIALIAAISFSIGIRFYFNLAYLAKTSIIRASIVEVLLLVSLCSVLHLGDSLKLGYRTPLGSVPFSSILSIVSVNVLLFHSTPEVLLGLKNAIRLDLLVTSTMLPLTIGFISAGGLIFKKPFYPWGAKDLDYHIRASTSFLYLLAYLILTSIVFIASIYAYLGVEPTIGDDYILFAVYLYSVAVFVASLVQAAKKVRSFYLYFSAIFVALLLYVYTPMRATLAYYLAALAILLSLPYLIYAYGKKKQLNTYDGFVIISALLILVFMTSYHSAGPPVVADVLKGDIMYDELRIRYLSHTVTFVNQPTLNESIYTRIELKLRIDDTNATIKYTYYSLRKAHSSESAIASKGYWSYRVSVSSYRSEGGDVIEVAVNKYSWNVSLNAVMPPALALALYCQRFGRAVE